MRLSFVVFQAGVQDFLDAMELSAPEVAHVVETPLDCVEAGIDRFELGLELCVKESNE